MFESILQIALGIVMIVIGVANWKGNISSLHSYHRHRVKEEDILPFGRQTGLGMFIMGGGLILSGILCLVAWLAETKILMIAGAVVTVLSLVVGLIISFRAMIKYNKGIF